MTADKLRDGRPRGWFWVDNATLDDWLPKVGPSAWAVYTVLARMCDQEGRSFPSYGTLATRTGTSRPTVIKAIETLVEHGLVTVEHRHNTSNAYQLTSGSAGKEILPGQDSLPALVKNLDPASKTVLPALVKNLDPKEERLNKTHLTRPTEGESARERATPERRTARATRISDDFAVTDALREWAASEVPGVDLSRETAKFLDYWRGTGKAHADWPATWRNWMRRASESPPAARNGHAQARAPTAKQRSQEWIDREVRGIPT